MVNQNPKAPVVLVQPQVPEEVIKFTQEIQYKSKEATVQQLDQLKQRIQHAQNNAQIWVSQARTSAQVQKLVKGLDQLEANVKQQYAVSLGALSQQKQVVEDMQLLKKLNQNVKNAGSGLQKSLSQLDVPSIPANQQKLQHDEPRSPKLLFRFRKSSLDQPNKEVEYKDKDDIAAQFLEQSRLALQQCQEQLKQTADNCQDNLTNLRHMMQNKLQINQDKGLQELTLNLPFNFGFGLQQLLGEKMSNDQLMDYLQDDANVLPHGPFQREAERRKRRRDLAKHSDLGEDGRHIAIFTTASLPWMTGTSVNPLLRAAFLANDKSCDRKVTLVIPWLSKKDQDTVYPKGKRFSTPEEQETFVRSWVEERTGFPSNFNIRWYPGRFAAEKQSILPVGDLTSWIPDHEADVAVLEEPEHLTWYHHGRRFNDKFAHVVGVMHTNYIDYVRREEDGEKKAGIMKAVNQWVCRAHCHKVIKLSDAVQDLPRQETLFVHGVSPQFISVGDSIKQQHQAGSSPFDKGAYFIAKVLWGKGYTELLDMVHAAESKYGYSLPMDVYGYGDDLEAVQETSKVRRLQLTFHGAKDHLSEDIQGYRVFVNPSTSDVVATTSAEALAMGKWLVCAEHPCNKFFSQFSNCLIYKNDEEFAQKMQYAMTHDPKPLSEEQRKWLTWEDATARFVKQAGIEQRHQAGPLDHLAYMTHNSLSGIEPIRVLAGAGANTKDTPQRVEDFVPVESAVGWLDDPKRLKGEQGKTAT